MDPITTAALVSALGTGLFEVFKIVFNKGIEKGIVEPAVEPLRDWVSGGYDKHKDKAALDAALLGALDDLDKEQGLGAADRLVAGWKVLDANPSARQALAAAAVEMARFDPQRIPPELLMELNLDEARRDLLARFLFHLRNRLGAVENYKDGVACADRLEARSELTGLTREVIALQAQVARLATVSEAMAADRRLSTADRQALANYLDNVRQQWSNLTLPLIRQRTGEVVSAGLKQVFVPLSLRDRYAEELARQKREREFRGKVAPEWIYAKEIRPIGLGELLARYPRFILTGPPGCGKSTLLARLALAFAEDRARQDLGWEGPRLLPVLLHLRSFSGFLWGQHGEFAEPSPRALVAYLEESFRTGQGIALTPDFFDHRLDEGNCLVLMDGLDEVSWDIDQVEVAQQVLAFIKHYGSKGNRFGLASRPYGYERIPWQLRPAELVEAEVNPLDPPGIRQLVDNLLALIEPDLRLRQADSSDLTRAILASDDLTQLAETPFFCSALVHVYKYLRARLPERHGLLAESEPRGYASAHTNFLEFLTARVLDEEEQSETLDRTECFPNGKPGWARQLLLMAGRLPFDMAGYLPGPEPGWVEDALHDAMTDIDYEPWARADAADALDALAWLPPDLHAYIRIDAEAVTKHGLSRPSGVDLPFYIAKYPVTNAQYERFAGDEDNFKDKSLWTDFPKYDENSWRMGEQTWTDQGWGWLQDALKNESLSPDGKRLLPRDWSDPLFGIAPRGVPVVGISWYEANAYCRWLLRHWAELVEGRANPGWSPREVRLPREAEWALAAGGDQDENRYPWDPPGKTTIDEAEIIRRANVFERGARRTTLVGMYPLGESWPFKLWDLAGNVWEWQANFSDKDLDFLSLRGGSWYSSHRRARVAVRNLIHPGFQWSACGFRVVAFPS